MFIAARPIIFHEPSGPVHCHRPESRSQAHNGTAAAQLLMQMPCEANISALLLAFP
jgi:hypothetical protein